MKVLIISQNNPVSFLWPDGSLPPDTELIWAHQFQPEQTGGCSVMFDLDFETDIKRMEEYRNSGKPVILGSVLYTLEELGIRHESVARINHWMLQAGNPLLETSFLPEHAATFDSLFKTLKLNYQYTTDITGFLTTRILSLLINEAFLALEEGVSEKEEIDTAMKLGTNYPKGPFEWMEAIGPSRILQLLLKLSAEDKRYTPASLLQKSAIDGTPSKH